MSIPILSREKRIAALKEARRIRGKRAQIKKDLKAANINLKELLDTKNKDFLAASGMKVFDLIRALPGFGDVRTNNILKKLQINPKKKFKGIGEKQKMRFMDFLDKL